MWRYQLQQCSRKRLLTRHRERVFNPTIVTNASFMLQREIDTTGSTNLSRRRLSNHRNGVYMAGNAWTGALGLGREGMTSSDTSHVSEEQRNNAFAVVDVKVRDRVQSK